MMQGVRYRADHRRRGHRTSDSNATRRERRQTGVSAVSLLPHLTISTRRRSIPPPQEQQTSLSGSPFIITTHILTTSAPECTFSQALGRQQPPLQPRDASFAQGLHRAASAGRPISALPWTAPCRLREGLTIHAGLCSLRRCLFSVLAATHHQLSPSGQLCRYPLHVRCPIASMLQG
jgi:hypothetical protein